LIKKLTNITQMLWYTHRSKTAYQPNSKAGVHYEKYQNFLLKSDPCCCYHCKIQQSIL